MCCDGFEGGIWVKGQVCEAYFWMPIYTLHHPSPIPEDSHVDETDFGRREKLDLSLYRKSSLHVTFDCSLECHVWDECGHQSFKSNSGCSRL